MPVCVRCGGELREGARFCEQCGQPLGLTPGMPPPAVILPTPTGEFRSITAYLKEGWDLFRQYPGGFIGFTALVLGIAIVLGLFLGLIGVWSQSIALTLLLTWILGSLFFPLFAGYFTVPALLLQGQRPQFGDFFAGYQFFVHLMLLFLVTSLFIGLGSVFLGPVGPFLAVSYILAMPLLVDRRLSFWGAMEASRRGIWQFFMAVLGLVLVLNTLMTVWLAALYLSLLPLMIGSSGLVLGRMTGVGLAGGILGVILITLNAILAIATYLITYPFAFCALSILYRDLFGLETTSFRTPRYPYYPPPPGWTPPGPPPFQAPPGQTSG